MFKCSAFCARFAIRPAPHAGDRYRRAPARARGRDAEFALQANHLTIDFLDLANERFFALRKFNELSKSRAQNIRKHFSPSAKIENATLRYLRLHFSSL